MCMIVHLRQLRHKLSLIILMDHTIPFRARIKKAVPASEPKPKPEPETKPETKDKRRKKIEK